MKRFGAQLHKKAQSLRLSATERSLLRDRVVSYMEYHPLPKEQKSFVVSELVSEPYKAFNFTRVQIGGFMGALTMMMLVVIPTLAEQAMPGDVLYPVKVQFNEELRSTLSFSPYAKVEWETKRLERRLAEARLLADEGRLTEEIEAEVAQAVQAHSQAAQQSIAAIRSSDSDEAAIAEITFASVLEVQSEVLENRDASTDDTGRSVAALAHAVAEARNGVVASNSNTNPSFEKLFARLEAETTHAEELLASVQTDATPEQTRDIDRRFEDIKRKISAAAELRTTALAASSTPDGRDMEWDARQILKAALTDTRKLITFMTDIDVRTNVTIDELVPVTLTEEELKADLDERLDALTSVEEQLERLVVEEESEPKFADGQDRFMETLEAATAAYAADDLILAIALVTEAELLVHDLLMMGTLVPVTTEAAASTTDSFEMDIESATTTATSGNQTGS